MQIGNRKLALLLTLVGLAGTSGCTNAIREGVLLGTSSGYNTAVDAFVQSLFAEFTEIILPENEGDEGGDG